MKVLLNLTIISLLFFSCGGSEEPEIMEIAPFAFEGDWLGSWSDSLFPSISVSARVRKTGDNTYSGSFYYNNSGNDSYTPCCGGANDGTIKFETDGGDNLMNFVYVQTAPEYRGGCPGTYNGSGAINKSLNRLIINFTGTDCDGFHDQGEIVWRLDQ